MDPSTKEKLLAAFRGGASRLGEAAILAQVPYHDATLAASKLLAEGIIVYDGHRGYSVASGPR